MHENYMKFDRIIKARNLTPYRVALDCGIAHTYFYRWKAGRIPKVDKLKKIADYLQVKIDDLV